MILKDGCLEWPERFSDPSAFGRVIHDSGEISKDSMVFEEGAGVLGERFKGTPERGEGTPELGMRMRPRRLLHCGGPTAGRRCGSA